MPMKKAISPLTAGEFWELCGDEKRRQLVRGEVEEMTASGAMHGGVTGDLHSYLGVHVLRNDLGRVFAAETGYFILKDPDTVIAPDCSFVRKDRLPRPLPRGFLSLAPDLAVETFSFDDRPGDIQKKVNLWLEAGTTLVWVIHPGRRTAVIHRPGAAPRTLDEQGILEGEDVLPGFRLPLAELFREP